MSVVFSEVIMKREPKGCVCMNVGFGKWEDEGEMPRRTLDSDDTSGVGVA